MTRSKRRKLERARNPKIRAALRGLPLASASAFLAGAPVAFAQQANEGALEEVIITAQKREENLQSVPISVQAIGTEKLEQLHIEGFDDYVKFLPSVTFQAGGSGGGASGPGFSRVLMRGVSSDSNLNHSGPLPTVGTYLDEQPITTIQGALDMHLYDIARVEALAGPQGTLYGASSEAGTVRIITNKPNPDKFEAGYEVQGNTIAHGDPGGVMQGFVNVPLSPSAAIRLVAWGEHKGGYIDNIRATRTFPQFGITINNDNLVKKNENDVTTYGGRAALRVDLNDNWTITPTLMAQKTKAGGFFSSNPALGDDYKIEHFSPDDSEDKWVDAALTLEGKISNFDLTYSGAFLKRDDQSRTDYSDYSLAYDISIPSYTDPIVDNSGNHINPTQWILGKDRYQKISQELRIASPKEWRVRFVAGVFYQRQQHGIEQAYEIQNLAKSLWVTGWPNTWWLTEQMRVDRDQAAFGEVTFDVTSSLSLTAGIRHFKYDNTLAGFRGFGLNNPLSAGSGLGEAGVCTPGDFHGAPCSSFDKRTSDSGNTPKVTATYRIDDSRLVYATYSKGFRPGGINRVGDLPPYGADFLKNYEIGWKTSWAGNRVRFNGAFFREDWQDFQFAFLGANSLTRIANAGSARVKGFESEVAWAAGGGLTLSAGLTLLDPEITENYCGEIDANGGAITDCADPQAPKGTQLPATSKVKGNIVARYSFPLGQFDAHAQAAYVFQSAQWADLRIQQRTDLGQQGAYGTGDITFGLGKGSYAWELFVTNLFDKHADGYRFTQCNSCSIVANYVSPVQPRTIGVTFNQKF